MNEAKWIWVNDCPQSNEYAFFEDDFVVDGDTVVFRIAAETDYVLYINGNIAGFGQFAGYPFEKYFDELDVTSLCRRGINHLFITVRYEGINSATHIDDGAGVIFSLESDGKRLLVSNENTRGGYDSGYLQHTTQVITSQLGLSSGMRTRSPLVHTPCVEVKKTRNIQKRPVKKTEIGAFVEAPPLSAGSHLYDLGREEAGYLVLKVRSAAPGRIQVAYGEHLADGTVRRVIGARTFSLDFELSGGEETFTQLFVRIAARYLEVCGAGDDVEVLSIGLLAVLYPVTEKGLALEGVDQRIYDTAVRTLRLCMNAHYEDCPWREQALYVLDSRNQMLCGYYAFVETEFQRENLIFMSKGIRQDGLLELTYPAIDTPAIPFFSLLYPVAVWEYIEHTGDISIVSETMETMRRILNTFESAICENGLIAEFDSPYWNFYEWSESSTGYQSSPSPYSLILNCAYVYACERFRNICQAAGTACAIGSGTVKAAINQQFFCESTGLFSLYPCCERYSQLGNAFALLIGLGDERTVEAVKQDDRLIPATLSMAAFVYDALIARSENAQAYILADIHSKYGYMLEQGATSFWETIEGESAFDNAGSLCHGWSALPVYYYHLFFDK